MWNWLKKTGYFIALSASGVLLLFSGGTVETIPPVGGPVSSGLVFQEVWRDTGEILIVYDLRSNEVFPDFQPKATHQTLIGNVTRATGDPQGNFETVGVSKEIYKQLIDSYKAALQPQKDAEKAAIELANKNLIDKAKRELNQSELERLEELIITEGFRFNENPTF